MINHNKDDILQGLEIKFDNCIEFNMTPVESVALYAIYQGFNGSSDLAIINSLLKRGLIRKETYSRKVNKGTAYIYKCTPTEKGKIMLRKIVFKANQIPEHLQERISYLAKELREIFPEGKKEGTAYQWRGSTLLIMRRLNMFFHKYGEEYSDEEIINAAKAYVNGFNGNYRFMRILKYFIYKEGFNANGEIESTSDLLEYIENAGQETLNNDWASTLIQINVWVI